MNKLTLKQLCEVCGVSRRAVQGYEKYDLVKPTGKTERGYLLYDHDAKRKVEFIKSLQNYGFTVKEVVAYQHADCVEQREMLCDKLEAMKTVQHEIECYIRELRELIREKEAETTP